MRKSSSFLFVMCLVVALQTAHAQVLLPQEVQDPAARGLQRKYLPELKSISTEVRAHVFSYPFYFSRVLDVDEKQQQRMDQRSIRFEKYKEQTVLEITGNYYASYSAELMGRNRRAQQTLNDVVLPLLKAAVPRFAGKDTFAGYAVEVSHHVRRKVMGIPTEKPENVVLVAPRAVAERLIAARTPDERQAALEDVELYVDAEPIALHIDGAKPIAQVAEAREPERPQVENNVVPAMPLRGAAAAPSPAAPAALFLAPASSEPPVTKESLAALQSGHQDALNRMARELEAQAHFVSYAPPSFIEFQGRSYLGLSLTTNVKEAGSRYKLAALAFDDHIAHLVRPVLGYFKDGGQFSGIAFSTSVRVADSPSSIAIEFFLSLPALRSFAQYEITGQRLLNSGVVLINGERAGVDLQLAESAR